jgi:S1-C subfamily serine protease
MARGLASAAGCALLLAAGPLAAPAAAQPAAAEAMAFIRVVGDLRIDQRDARGAQVRRDVEVATGSGFVVSPTGLVLTNRHVVELELESEADGPELSLESRRIEVFVGSGGSLGAWEAHVVASDPESDLAALQLTAADLPYLALGDSEAAEAGQPVRVFGFPFGRQTEVARRSLDAVPQVTVTAGTLSAARADERGETRFLQTDAAMHPGNSGGPMLDEDGYVVGVVRMKLASDAASAGAGFSIPVNVVKDFLEANGLIDRLPHARLRPGVRHTLDWKQVALELPDGFSDRSPSRVQVDGGSSGEIGFRAFRWQTPWPAPGLEEALLGGEAVRDFVPAPATPRPRAARARRTAESLQGGRTPSIVGSGVGSDRFGARFRVEYAIVDLGPEKVVARYLGPADALAFNMSLLRDSLRGLEAAALARPSPRGASAEPLASFESASFPDGDGGVLLPRSWTREPASEPGCPAVPAFDAGLLARHPGDYAVVLRALRFRAGDPALLRSLVDCDDARRAAGRRYARRFARLGVGVVLRGALVAQGGHELLLELEAPEAKLAALEPLFERWMDAVAGPRSARYPLAR